MKQRGFTIIELITVIGIIALLATLLFPTYVSSRAKAQQTVCSSNLRQIGLATFMYAQDYDDKFPFGGDTGDVYTKKWHEKEGGKYWTIAKKLPLMPSVLAPYTKSAEIWHCPNDKGFGPGDAPEIGLDPKPSVYAVFGMSYFYDTHLTLMQKSLAGLVAYDAELPLREHGSSEIILFADPVGDWHGGHFYATTRYNAVLADGHTDTLSEGDIQRIGSYQFNPPTSAAPP